MHNLIIKAHAADGIGAPVYKADVSQDFPSYLVYARNLDFAMNTTFFVGYGHLRMAAMGLANRVPNEQEMETRKTLLRQSMENGCGGE